MINEKNKELEALICLLDGKITAYRMKCSDKEYDNTDIIKIQKELHKMWDKINK